MEQTDVPYITVNPTTTSIEPVEAVGVNSNIESDNDEDLYYGVPSCPRSLWCLATRPWFLVTVCSVILIQGILHGLFNETIQEWAIEFHIEKIYTEWIIVINKYIQGLLIILLIHISKLYNNRMKTAAICLAVFAISCSFLYIPHLVHGSFLQDSFLHLYHSVNGCWLALFVLVIFQNMLGLSSIFLLTQTIVFVEDHHNQRLAVILHGVVLAVEQVSPYVGKALALTKTSSSNLFGSYGWITIIVFLLVFCVLLGMYPVYLDSKTKRNCISLDSSTQKRDLISTMCRILNNKVVMCNIFVAVIFTSALVNMSILDNKYDMSLFAIPDDSISSNPLPINYILLVLTPLSMIVFIIFTASVITRYEMRAVNLAVFHVSAPVLMSMFYILLVFTRCEKVQLNNHMMNDTCNNCDCANVPFEPICVKELHMNFFAPCYAGCSNPVLLNDTMVYINCTYTNSLLAYPGVCSMESCYSSWLSKETIQLATSTFGSGAWLSHIVNTLSLVDFFDRAYVLGLYFALSGFIGNGFIRLMYKSVADSACLYMSTGICRLYDPDTLSLYSLSMTMGLLWLSAAGAIMMLYLLNKQNKINSEARNCCNNFCLLFRMNNQLIEDSNNNVELQRVPSVVSSESIPIDFETKNNEDDFLLNVANQDTRDLTHMDEAVHEIIYMEETTV